MTEAPIRLQKFLSQQGVCSRREAEDLMFLKRIKVNGEFAQVGDKVTGDEEIIVNNKVIATRKSPKKVYLKFYKPIGVECTLRAFSDHTSLASFDFGPERVFPVGRLDKNSRGLILLTNDGDLTYKLMHPKFQHEKEYEVQVERKLRTEDLNGLSQGILLEEGKTAPCKIKKLGFDKFQIILREGKKRQIRRMCKALGHDVVDLVRVRIENIQLGDMAAGKVVPLSAVEKKQLLGSL